MLGASLATRTAAPLADAAGAVLGGWGRMLLLVGATVSMFGYVSGMTLAVPRALFAFARDGFLPSAIASVHPRFHTPYVAIVIQSAIVCTLAISSTFGSLAVLANLATLVLYFLCCLAAWQLRRRGVQAGGVPFRIPAAGILPFVACAVIAWLLTSITLREWGALAIALVVAALIFVLTRGRRAALAARAS